MSRKDKIIELLGEYIDIRKAIYEALQARDGEAKELLSIPYLKRLSIYSMFESMKLLKIALLVL